MALTRRVSEECVRLVAEGHTNREIGDRLFISEKTVSVHVSNAMAKLGALSRYEAAARGRARGACSETSRAVPRAAGRSGTRGTSAGRTGS